MKLCSCNKKTVFALFYIKPTNLSPEIYNLPRTVLLQRQSFLLRGRNFILNGNKCIRKTNRKTLIQHMENKTLKESSIQIIPVNFSIKQP